MRRSWMVLFLLSLSSCATYSDTLQPPRQSVGKWALGVGINAAYGLWSPRWGYADGVQEPFDTTWTSVMLNPVAIAFDDTSLVVLNKRGKYLLTAKTRNGKAIWKSTRSEKRYLELRAELGIPDSLMLKSIP